MPYRMQVFERFKQYKSPLLLTLLTVLTIMAFEVNSQANCDLLYSGAKGFYVPQVDWLTMERIENLGERGSFVSGYYSEYTNNGIPPFIVGHIDDLEVKGNAYFRQYGYGTGYLISNTAYYIKFRLPNTIAIEYAKKEIKKKNNPVTSFTFVPYTYVPRDEILVSKHYSAKEIVMYEPTKPAENPQDEFYFTHDRLLHGAFWLASGEEIADPLSSRHRLLQELREIAPLDTIDVVIKYENYLADSESASIRLSYLDESLYPQLSSFVFDKDSYYIGIYDLQLKSLRALYLLTRSSQSLLTYKDNKNIFLDTTDTNVYYKKKRYNIAPFLTAKQKALVYLLWLKYKDVPEVELKDLDKVREIIYRRLMSGN